MGRPGRLATARISERRTRAPARCGRPCWPAGAFPGYTEIATLALDEVEPTDGRLLHADRRELSTGRRYTYVVDGGFAAPRQRSVGASVRDVHRGAAGPRGRDGGGGDGEARVSWTAPTSLRDGSPSEPSPTTSCAPRPGRASRLRRAHRPRRHRVRRSRLQNDQTYAYSVRGIRTAADTSAYGPLSARVAVTPVDMTPPAAPTDVVAIVSPGAVRVSWRASPDADVATYVVYRAAAGREFERGLHPGHGHHVHDPEVAPGSYRYAVAPRMEARGPTRARGRARPWSPCLDFTGGGCYGHEQKDNGDGYMSQGPQAPPGRARSVAGR